MMKDGTRSLSCLRNGLGNLAGPGRSNEHENPHVVAGDDTALATVEEGKELDRDDEVALAQALDHPRRMYGREIFTPVRRYDREPG